MDSRLYLCLNAWLQTADHNYIAGRILWFDHFETQACNLFWLSIEQLIKILILQQKEKEILEANDDLDILHKKVDKYAKRIAAFHGFEELRVKLSQEYPGFNIDKFESVFKKLEEYFFRRYYVRKSTSIYIFLIDDIDALYFCLRKLVKAEIGLGTIDEIFIQRKNRWQHPLPSFQMAYLNNKHFQTRKHTSINYLVNGKSYHENGSND